MTTYKALDNEETSIGAHAILITTDNNILLQQRDNNPQLINPWSISMFGGTIKKKDSILKGLRRELAEELELDISKHKVQKLGAFKKSKDIDGVDYLIHVFVIANIKLDKLVVHEGNVFVGNNDKNLVNNPKLTRITKLALDAYFKSQ